MMDDDDESSGFLLRRATQDKLTYKNTIQSRINWCLITMGTMQFPISVKALERAIIFDVTGYKFKTSIEKIHEEVKEKTEKRETDAKKEMGRQFFKRSVQAKFKIRQQERYWLDIYDELIQLIAQHNLLVEYQKVIGVKEVGKMDDSEESS